VRLTELTREETMADIEKEFLGRQVDWKGKYKAPPFTPRLKNVDLGTENIAGERYFSPAFMQQEWESVWKKTWQLVHRADVLEEPGAFYTHELGKESFVFIRGNDDVIRGFYNVCRHRGNRLCQLSEGYIEKFSCPYHGWQWNIDGSLKKVADPEFFRQFDNGIPKDDLGLVPVQVDIWEGYLWFNMDLDAGALKEYLGDIGVHLESYDFEKSTLIDLQTFEWNGNWKHAWDAFNESYHFAALHPNMVEIGEGHDIPIELHGVHSRMLNYNRTVSEVLDERDSWTDLRRRFMLSAEMKGTSPDLDAKQASVPEVLGKPIAAKDIHLHEIEYRRSIENETTLPYKQLNDEQLVHQYHYSFFPNTTFTQSADGGAIFRYRPHPLDPGKCYFDLFIVAILPEGTEVPERAEHKIHRFDDGIDYVKILEGTFDPAFAEVLGEDASNMPTLQAGCQSDSFKGSILGDQEIRLRHFHQMIDGFIDGTITTNNLPAQDAFLD
jgi:phenylpropionate dioxygenase-like ring-hydroxylating dioxygenase large terminal subunit